MGNKMHQTGEWCVSLHCDSNEALFFFHDTSLACSKKKTHYCSCGALFMKYLTSHSPNLCSNHSVFVWSIIWVHLGHVDSEGRNVAFIVFSLNNTFPSDQIQVNPTDWLMQLCFQVNLLLIKQVAQISERSKKKKKTSQREWERNWQHGGLDQTDWFWFAFCSAMLDREKSPSKQTQRIFSHWEHVMDFPESIGTIMWNQLSLQVSSVFFFFYLCKLFLNR